MGAVYNSMEVDGKATKQEVTSQFNDRRESDGYECGHSYSGSFSEFSGLEFSSKVFHSENAAHDWVSDNAEKWGPAIAVKYAVFEDTKTLQSLRNQMQVLRNKVGAARTKVWEANQKMRINNRTEKPSYVTKAESNYEKAQNTINPKIAAKEEKYSTIEQKLAAKSKKTKWLMGGWCSE